MALLETYNINAMATQISREFYINENNHADDKSYILMDEMRLFAYFVKKTSGIFTARFGILFLYVTVVSINVDLFDI